MINPNKNKEEILQKVERVAHFTKIWRKYYKG